MPPRVAMFGVLRGEGAVMLSYNSTYTVSITNSPCTLDSIPYSCTSPMHMCILLCAGICAYSFAPAYVHTPLRRVITSTCSYTARAHTLHATTSSCVITPTATAYAPHNLCILAATPDTSAMRRHVRVRTYKTHAHIHDYTIAYARTIYIRI